jgi:hypothetical protein
LQVLDQIRSVDSEVMAAQAPEPFSSLLRRMLTADPGQRSITMKEVAETLLGTCESPVLINPPEFSPTAV